MKILHIITGLNLGGAEMALYKLVANIDPTRFQNSVVALLGEGPVGEMIRAEGVEVKCLNYKQGLANPFMLVDMIRTIRRKQPDIIHTWMYHANLVGSIASLFVKRTPMIWGIRHSKLSAASSKGLTRTVASVCAWASFIVPYRIVLNSQESRDYHISIGYNAAKMHVIPNGFDLDVFIPNPEWRKAIRNSWEVTDGTIVVGTVSRFHADKDIRSFLEAASIVSKRQDNFRFVLCGNGLSEDNSTLEQWINELDLKSYVRLLGRQEDIPAVLNGFDIFALSSVTESFPNVVGEAMACGVPCVITNVGDFETIVGDTGLIVPVADPNEMSRTWLQLSASNLIDLGQRARQRINDHFRLEGIVKLYSELYSDVVQRVGN